MSAGKGVMAVGVHFISLELGGRTMGICRPMMATYRPHNSPLMEWVQTRGRLRSNKAMIDRRNLSGLVHALKAGEAVWFAPDQDYGPKGSVFAPFFSRAPGRNDQRHLRSVAPLGCQNADHQHGA
nr:lipid A biosynthesis lauroyl acyltransferase [Raoultella sp. NCTC 9187]